MLNPFFSRLEDQCFLIFFFVYEIIALSLLYSDYSAEMIPVSVTLMNARGFLCRGGFMLLWFLLLPVICIANLPSVGHILPGFQVSQMNRIDNSGLFLLSNDSNFAFGFSAIPQDASMFLLVVVHVVSSTSTIVWTANRGSPVKNFDMFVFDVQGHAYLQSGGRKVWSIDTAGKVVAAMALQDSGNLVLLGNDGRPIWQSFNHPTDTLLSNQKFSVGMKLASDPNQKNLTYYLQFESGDLLLYAGFRTLQPYWSVGKDNRKFIKRTGGGVHSASLEYNSWRFYDQNQILLSQFVLADSDVVNGTWAAVLANNGIISFYHLQDRKSNTAERMKIPQKSCSMPESCDSYYVCSKDNQCQCPSVLKSHVNCKPEILSPCTSSNASIELVSLGDRLDYFALEFVPAFLKSDLKGCQDACHKSCSCHVLFFENSTRNCLLFDVIGNLRQSNLSSNKYVSYVKLSTAGSNKLISRGREGSGNKKQFLIVGIIVVVTIIIIAGIVYLGLRFLKRKKRKMPIEESSEDDSFLDNLSGMPIRFSYEELQTATENFRLKLGQGGFGSVYQGVLKDGTKVAVKQLEGIGQGKKEFQAEVSIIGSIHHVHLVKLKGFCTEENHRLLVYEYMANGSLDKWIFRNNNGLQLDWSTRFNIALGVAKALAYLHEDCDAKIVHCDIKPENVLLDDNHQAKVSDFGLAKLMTKAQSNVFTTLRGTRGYLAPEWITNYTISEKCDVYSFGMVFLEMIGGRKNFDLKESSDRCHFPSYAFKMMEEGKPREVFDPKLKVDANDERVLTAIKVALWCIQEEIYLRPPMNTVVQMLEGHLETPQPPTSSQMISHLYSSLYKLTGEEATSSGSLQLFSNASVSDVQLSGPR